MALTLTIRSGDAPPQAVAFDAPRVVLGRAEGCDVLLPDPSVSHRHASIRQRGSQYIILDENSTNGTFVGPVKLSGGAPRVLKTGDMLRLGRVWLEVDLSTAVTTPNPAQLTKEIALRLISSALDAEGAASAHPEIRVIGGPADATTLVLDRFGSPYTIGRGKGSDLLLEDDSISRKHLEVFRRGLHVYVRELASKNGSTLGDTPLERNVDTLWPRTKQLRVAQYTLALYDVVADVLAELDAAPDEIVDEAEAPVGAPRATGATDWATEARGAPPQRRGEGRESVAAAPPRPSPGRNLGSQRERSWTMADGLIALLAIVVIALSIGGLSWLFGVQ